MPLSIRPTPDAEARRYRAAQLALFDALAAGTVASTTVPLRTQYIGAATCLTLVHLLPDALAGRIDAAVLQPLAAFRSTHHWYALPDLHLTLKNVRRARPGGSGDVEDLATRAGAPMARACGAIAPLHFELLGPVCLPTSIVVRALGTPAHRDAVRRLDQALAQAGVHDDKVYASTEVYIGNVTICRYTEPPAPELLDAVGRLRDRDLGTHTVRSATLVQCDEVCSAASRVVFGDYVLAGADAAEEE